MYEIIRNASNYKDVNEANGIETGESYIDNDGNPLPGVTVPDQSISIKDLVERQRRGQWVPTKDAKYDDDVKEFNKNLPDLSKLTKIELLEYATGLTGFIRETRNTIAEFNAKKKAESKVSPTPPADPQKEV